MLVWPATAQEQPTSQEVLKELRELRARVEQLEEKYTRQHEEDQRTITELKTQLEELRQTVPPEAPEEEAEALAEEVPTPVPNDITAMADEETVDK